MTTYPNIGLTLPVQGDAGAGLWDETQDANTALLDAHDHSSGKGVRITPAAININADLPLNSSWGITTANRISFASVAAPSTNKSVFVSDGSGGLTANELYWRSNTGTNVKLTSGSALNVAAFTGGIGGDYAAVGAAVAYDDAADRYTFKQESPGNWARLACGPVRLFEFNTSESVYVEMAAPAALGASYTVTWPTAVPASTSALTMSSSGVVAAGMSQTWQHSPALVSLSDATASLVAGSFGGGTAPRVTLSTSVNPHSFPLSIPVGTITAFSVHAHKSSAAGTLSVKLVEAANGQGVGGLTQIGSTQSNGANNPGDITLSQSGLSFAMTAGRQYYIEVIGGGTTGDNIGSYSATVTV